MLILEREINEQIMIGDSIVITVTNIWAGKVRLGVEADRSVPVHRSEIQSKIIAARRNNGEAR